MADATDGLGTNNLCLTLQEKLLSGDLKYEIITVVDDPVNSVSVGRLKPASECDASAYCYFRIQRFFFENRIWLSGLQFTNGLGVYHEFRMVTTEDIINLLKYLPDARLTHNADEFKLYINNKVQSAGTLAWNDCVLNNKYNFAGYYSTKNSGLLFGNLRGSDNGYIDEDINNSQLPGIWSIPEGAEDGKKILNGQYALKELGVGVNTYDFYVIANSFSGTLQDIRNLFSVGLRLYFSTKDGLVKSLSLSNPMEMINGYTCFFLGTIEVSNSFATGMCPVLLLVLGTTKNIVHCVLQEGEKLAADYVTLNSLKIGDKIYFNRNPLKYVTISGEKHGNFETSTTDGCWWVCTRSSQSAMTGNGYFGGVDDGGDPGTGGTGIGGGFDKNWLIKRNIKPIDIKIYSPSAFNTKPQSAGEACCKPDEAYICARQHGRATATVNTKSTGDIGLNADQNIDANAGENITVKAGQYISVRANSTVTVKGSAIFLN